MAKRDIEHFFSDSARFKGLSDGVIAVVITLLVLDLHVPDHPADTSNAAILQLFHDYLPKLVAYLISFYVISKQWASHNFLFRHVETISSNIISINFFYLLAVTFIPFPTSLMGEYTNSITTVVFSLALVFPQIILVIMYYMILRDPVLSIEFKQQDPNVIEMNQFFVVMSRIFIAVGLLVAVLAWWFSTNALYAWLLLALGKPILNRVYKRDRQK